MAKLKYQPKGFGQEHQDRMREEVRNLTALEVVGRTKTTMLKHLAGNALKAMLSGESNGVSEAAFMSALSSFDATLSVIELWQDEQERKAQTSVAPIEATTQN